MESKEKKSKVFQEYRRGVLPDTQANVFEGFVRGQDAMDRQTRKNPACKAVNDSVWEISLVDWSRMFRVYLN